MMIFQTSVAYRRTGFLLLRRPPGRSSQDAFLPRRLLERSAKVSDELGGGSITALSRHKQEICSPPIRSNVISITDGQIFLGDGLNAGTVQPLRRGFICIRVGGSAQIKAMKSCWYTSYRPCSYRELEAFTKFGSDFWTQQHRLSWTVDVKRQRWSLETTCSQNHYLLRNK